MKLNVFIGILIPFVGTTLGAAAVFMMRKISVIKCKVFYQVLQQE